MVPHTTWEVIHIKPCVGVSGSGGSKWRLNFLWYIRNGIRIYTFGILAALSKSFSTCFPTSFTSLKCCTPYYSLRKQDNVLFGYKALPYLIRKPTILLFLKTEKGNNYCRVGKHAKQTSYFQKNASVYQKHNSCFNYSGCVRLFLHSQHPTSTPSRPTTNMGLCEHILQKFHQGSVARCQWGCVLAEVCKSFHDGTMSVDCQKPLTLRGVRVLFSKFFTSDKKSNFNSIKIILKAGLWQRKFLSVTPLESWSGTTLEASLSWHCVEKRELQHVSLEVEFSQASNL